MRISAFAFLLVIISALSPLQVYAKDEVIFSAQVENDIFAGTDRNFTNGLRLSLTYVPDESPNPIHDLLYSFPLHRQKPDDYGQRWASVTLGHSMFTPGDLSSTALIPSDRPYAGWLYVGAGITVEDEHHQHNLELDVGVVGEISGAEAVQTWWHDQFGFPEPRGWDNQIDNEPGFVLYYHQAWKERHMLDMFGLEFDTAPHIGGALGTIFTYANIGATLRIGNDLSRDFGAPPRIAPSLPGSDRFASQPGFAWYLFAGVDGRLVARNIFLDGNTFQSSHSVDKKPFVGDAQVGLVLAYGAARLAITRVFRSDEFDTQVGGHEFGSVTLSFAF